MTERELEVWLADWFGREGVEVVEDSFHADSDGSACSTCGDKVAGGGVEIFLRRLAVDLRDALGLAA